MTDGVLLHGSQPLVSLALAWPTEAPLERIHQLLSGQHHVVSTYTGLKNLIDETYRKLLNAQLKKTAERIHEHIHQTTACVSVGLPTSILAGLSR